MRIVQSYDHKCTATFFYETRCTCGGTVVQSMKIALMLLVGWQERHMAMACKSFPVIPKSSVLGMWPNVEQLENRRMS